MPEPGTVVPPGPRSPLLICPRLGVQVGGLDGGHGQGLADGDRCFASAAWLLAQHADHDPGFQRRCLELLTDAVAAGDTDPVNLAYLTDRVAVHEHRPQVYGTQLRWEGDRCVPGDIADPELVDQRRAEVGLMPLAEYLDLTRRRHTRPADSG